jgi:hypothetical protein
LKSYRKRKENMTTRRNTTKEKSSPLQKAFNALNKGVSLRTLEGKVIKPLKVLIGPERDLVLLFFPNGKWAGRRGQDDLSVTGGRVGGYRLNTLATVDGLVSAKYLTKEEGKAFQQWFREEDEWNTTKNNVRILTELAQRYGYSIQKK